MEPTMWRVVVVLNMHTKFREKLSRVMKPVSDTNSEPGLPVFLSRRIGSSEAHKRTLVAGKEELHCEDLQEGSN